MSLDANKALYQRYFAILLEKTPEKLDEVLAPDFVGHDLPPGLPPGPEALKRFRRMVDTVMPDQAALVTTSFTSVRSEADRISVYAVSPSAPA
jgi:ketosteroid isomerase-like protein